MSVVHAYNDNDFIYEMMNELAKARYKFPDQTLWVTLAALTEEVGELNQAFLHHYFQPGKGVTTDDIKKEAIQVAVMAMRVLLDARWPNGAIEED